MIVKCRPYTRHTDRYGKITIGDIKQFVCAHPNCDSFQIDYNEAKKISSIIKNLLETGEQ